LTAKRDGKLYEDDGNDVEARDEEEVREE